MTATILDYWNKIMPDSKPRNSQLATFDWIQDLSPEVKYILLEMPVGGGKSPVGLAVSAWMSHGYGSSFILTPQKILQRQYEQTFNVDVLHSMYGKSNYKCEQKNCKCDVGASIKPACVSCPHKISFSKAKRSPNMVLNYTLGLLYFSYLDEKTLPSRKFMIMDECHNLESQLIEFGTFTISSLTCGKIGGVKFYKPEDILDAYDWMRREYYPKLALYLSALSREKDQIEERHNGGPLSATDANVITNFIKYSRHEDHVTSVLLHGRDSIYNNFVLVQDKDKFTIKELYGRNAFHGIIKPKAEKFLFMSSTILNREGFCSDLGIDPAQSAFLSLDSEFKRENRMVYYKPTTKMNYGWDNNDPVRTAGRGKMAKAVHDILDLHKDVSGIIHTGSFKLSQWLVRELQTQKTHTVLHHNPDMTDNIINRETVINEYMASAKIRPTILVSPSITEGLDLKDDLGRFAIFAKVPYPSITDAWVKRRMEISGDWYRRQTLIEMIQGSGRVCRTPDDWGVTYILDESFGYLYNRTKRVVIPEWWENSLEII